MERVQNPNHEARFAEDPGDDLRLCGENGSPCVHQVGWGSQWGGEH